MNILVIDDSRVVHGFIDSFFADTEHKIVHVYDGSEALPVLEKKEVLFDVILLDWEMPILTGPETLDRIRKTDKTTPIIMVTTKNDLKSITTAMEKGANEYVMKPFTRDILLAKIASSLGREV